MTIFNRKMAIKYGLILLILSGVLTACVPPAPSCYLSIYKVIIVDNTPYLAAKLTVNDGIDLCPSSRDRFFSSQDNGITWQELFSLPIKILIPPEIPKPSQSTVCVPDDRNTCYRIDGKTQVDLSQNAGTFWKVDWQVPLYRMEYVARNPRQTNLVDVTPDVIPYDIGIVTVPKGYLVIVAMGNQGVLVKSPAGVWDRYLVLSLGFPVVARPLPFYATNLQEIQQSLEPEITWSLISSGIYLIFLSSYHWLRLRSSADYSSPFRRFWFISPFFLSVILLVLLIITVLIGVIITPSLMFSYATGIYDLLEKVLPFTNAIFFPCFIPIIGLLLSWLLLTIVSKKKKSIILSALTVFSFTIGLVLFTLFPFVLWTIGIIPVYKIGLIISIILGASTAILGFLPRSRVLQRINRYTHHIAL